MAITLNTPKTQVLVDYLQVNDAKKRYVTYLAASEAIVSCLLTNCKEDNAALAIVKLSKIADQLGEKTILDKSLFASCLRRVYDYKTDDCASSSLRTRVGSATCVYDVLGITKHFTNDDIFNINRHFDLYKQVVLATDDAIVIKDGNITF